LEQARIRVSDVGGVEMQKSREEFVGTHIRSKCRKRL
jgi:hypothetical protein